MTLYFLVYVKDIVLTLSSQEFKEDVIIKLGKEFSIKDLDDLKYFLRIHVTKLEDGGLFLTQHLANIL